MIVTNMKIIRAKNGWTQEWVGAQVGLSKSSVSRIENGKREPNRPLIIKLERLYNETHEFLFSEYIAPKTA